MCQPPSSSPLELLGPATRVDCEKKTCQEPFSQTKKSEVRSGLRLASAGFQVAYATATSAWIDTVSCGMATGCRFLPLFLAVFPSSSATVLTSPVLITSLKPGVRRQLSKLVSPCAMAMVQYFSSC